jgi:uncharacterized delta-60 repeat protein
VAFDVALDSAQRIVVVGRTNKLVTSGGKKPTTSLVRHAVVARLLPTGQLDTSFGSGGLVMWTPGNALFAEGFAVAVLADDRILVAGNAQFAGARRRDPPQGAVFLARFTSTGALDATFGSGGSATYDPSASTEYVLPKAMGIQSDGRIVLGSRVTTPSGSVLEPWVVTRHQADGAFDGGFGRNSATGRTLLRLSVGPADEIVSTGSGPHADDNDVVVELRTASGSLDAAFGEGGVAYAGPNPGMVSAVQAADGRVLVTAILTLPSGDREASVLRLLADGSLDQGFGSGGFGEPVALGFSISANGIGFAQDGDVYVAGSGGTGGPDGQFWWYVARYMGD